MKLIYTETGDIVEAGIAQMTEAEVEIVQRGNRFVFDWRKETGNEVYKIYLKKEEEIVGLLSLEDIPDELRIHVNLIEASIENTGRQKKISRITGCLIAFACEMSFKLGYQGFVSLVPKTKLIAHYVQTYGFLQYGRMLALSGERSKFLITEYLEDEL